LRPGDVIPAEATLDVRVGGTFRIVMKTPTEEHVQTGTYEDVEPPAKLVFTWIGSNHAPTQVIVEFLDLGDQSEIVITHKGFTIPDIAKRYESGGGIRHEMGLWAQLLKHRLESWLMRSLQGRQRFGRCITGLGMWNIIHWLGTFRK